MIQYRQYLSAAPCHCPQRVSVWSCWPVLSASPIPCPGHRWEVLASSYPLLVVPWAMHFPAPASIPPSWQSPREATHSETLPASWAVLDWGLSSGNHNWSTGGGFALGFGEFQKHLWNSTHHGIFRSPNWDIFTRFSIKKKLDYLGFELKTFTRWLNSSSKDSVKRCS